MASMQPERMPAVPDQRQTLCLFHSLITFRQNWAGSLLLMTGMDRNVALAALAAGAATLILEEDETLLRQSRADISFTVTSLDEAIRALKNEVRQGRAITVALAGESSRWVREMLDRGVQPDAVTGTEAHHFNASQFRPAVQAMAVREDFATSQRARRQQDERLLTEHPGQDRWLRAAPSLFPRDLRRFYLDDQRLQPLP